MTREEQQTRLAALRPEEVTPLMLDQAQVDAEAARVELESSELNLQASENALHELQAHIAALQEQLGQLETAGEKAAPPATRRPELERVLAYPQALLATEKERREGREKAQQLARERLTLAEKWLAGLRELRRLAEQHSQRIALEDLQARSEKEQRRWLAKAAEWRQAADSARDADSADSAARRLLEMRIQDAEERARLSQQRLRLAQLENTLEGVEAVPVSDNTPPDTLRTALEQARAVLSELTATVGLIERRSAVLNQQKDVTERRPAPTASSRRDAREEIRLINGLIERLNDRLRSARALLSRAAQHPAALEAAYQHAVRKGLLARRDLPSDLAGWHSVGREFAALPGALGSAFLAAGASLGRAFGAFTPDRWILLVLLELSWFMFARALARRLQQQGQSGFAAGVLAIPARVLRCTAWSLVPAGALTLSVWMANPSPPHEVVLLTLIGAAVGVRLLTGVGWSVLAAADIEPGRRNFRLYRQLRRLIVLGGLLATVTMLGHVLGLSTGVTNLTDRLLMLSVLLATVPALELRRLSLEWLAERWNSRPYWLRVVGLLAFLVPLSLLAASAVGLAGWVNLGWTIGGYLLVTLCVLALWLILLRLVAESATSLKGYANGHSANGELWAEGVIEPLARLSQVALSLAVWTVPLWMFGLDRNSPLMGALWNSLEAPLLTFGRTAVTAKGILLTGLALFALVQAGRWVRAVTYRFAYSGIADTGARHSLSVFSQYAVVLLGLLAALRTAGIDLTSLAIFAGALGVGIGFGLQSIANNLISGVLLLLERPLRTNDIVRIGEHEGEVTDIGMRSLTVRTWDNQELIIPNADVIAHPFTNWTHSDNVVRTLLSVGVSYDSDPHTAREVILDVLRHHPSVEPTPAPNVWLKEFAGSSVDFHVQYFTDVARHSRLDIKSSVLFGIWDGLKAAGIKIPYPQQDVYIRTMPEATQRAHEGNPRLQPVTSFGEDERSGGDTERALPQ
jgi:potassium efflux system protein